MRETIPWFYTNLVVEERMESETKCLLTVRQLIYEKDLYKKGSYKFKKNVSTGIFFITNLKEELFGLLMTLSLSASETANMMEINHRKFSENGMTEPKVANKIQQAGIG